MDFFQGVPIEKVEEQLKNCEFWDFLYEASKYAPYRPEDFLKNKEEFFKKFEDKQCLCVGDGTCDNGLLLSKLGVNVISTDISKVALEIGNKRAKEFSVEKNFKTIETGTLEYDFGQKFDLIIAVKIQFTRNFSEIHSQMKNLLNKNGVIFIIGYTPDNESNDPRKEFCYYAKDLKNDFKDFKTIECTEYDDVFGKKTSKMVSFIGQKMN